MEHNNEGFFRSPGRAGNTKYCVKLPKEGLIKVRFVGLWNDRKMLLVIGKLGGWGRFDCDLGTWISACIPRDLWHIKKWYAAIQS